MSECICSGNWRQIIAEIEPLVGLLFVDPKGNDWRLAGAVNGIDDYYYLMVDADGVCGLYSCVGNLEGWGFSQKQHPSSEE